MIIVVFVIVITIVIRVIPALAVVIGIEIHIFQLDLSSRQLCAAEFALNLDELIL